jgi:hypothetical protein
MTINAEIISDSMSTSGQRITTVLITAPRFILPEINTHRSFSRNASSSRAIPVAKLIADIRRDPARPVHWGANQPGMQARQELQGWRKTVTEKLWVGGMYLMTSLAFLADKCGAHKQVVNRMIEPWAHVRMVITSTQWSNFFALRRHPDAQPEIKVLADVIYDKMQTSMPKILAPGEWHLPYIDDETRKEALKCAIDNPHISINFTMPGGIKEPSIVERICIAISIARCARTSYFLFDGKKTTLDKDITLFYKLLGAVPLHASPAEHQAYPDDENQFPLYHGNFSGFIQFRKTLAGECQ